MAVVEAPLDVLPALGLIIGGRRILDASGGVHEHIYAATGKPTVSVALGGADEIDSAVGAARAALGGWRALSGADRRRLLLRLAALLEFHADELGRLQTVENATPIALAGRSAGLAAEYFSYNAGWTDKIGGAVIQVHGALDYAPDEPYGVVAVIPTWNGPLGSIGMVVAPALAAGNTVVLKPPEVTPFTALRVGELALEAGIPPGVLNVVPAGIEGGAALVRHRGIDKIHFTGSGSTARRILEGALENLTPVALELGGKSAHILFADCDLEQSVGQMIRTLVVLSGQVCIAGTRVLVDASIYEPACELVASMAGSIPIGDPLTESTMMGPVISAPACHRILGVIDRAQGDGARLLTGGYRLGDELEQGFYIAPTIFADVNNSSDLAQQEVFGPVLAIERFETEEEALRLANDTNYGLAGYVNTNDLRRAHRVAAALEAGNVWINGAGGIPVNAPFGGNKQSGTGRLGGVYGIREFMRPKNVWAAS